MINNIEEYLEQLRKELAGCDPATVHDALSDSEEYLRMALGADTDLQSIIEKYGTPEEVAAGYREGCKVYCESCGKNVPDTSQFCPNCGHQNLNEVPIAYKATGGQTSNAEIMSDARKSLRGKWWLAVWTGLVLWFVMAVVEAIEPLGILLTGPLYVGWAIFALAISRGQEARTGQIFDFSRFWQAFGAFWLFVIIVFLWSILLIVPGIIAALSYWQWNYIIADNKSIGPMEAMRKSKAIMNGHRWKLFCLFLRFIGWFLLCILTLGIGFLWFRPYVTVSCARFYDDINMEREPVSMWTP